MSIAADPVRLASPSAPPSLSVSVEPDFDFLSADYAALFAASEADAFRHPLWLDAFFHILAPARGARAVSIVGREHGRLVFVLPLILRRKTGVALLETADLGVCDYAMPVVDRGFAAGRPDLVACVRRALVPHDMLRIRPIREDALALWRLFLGGRAERLPFSAHAASPTLPYAAWRAEHFTPSHRRLLDRRRNRFAKGASLRLETLADGAEAACAVEAIRAMRAGRFPGDPIQEEATAQFYGRVAESGAAAGLARLVRLSADGETVGLVFALTHASRLHYLLIGCDYARFGRHSPGLLMYDGMMADWAEEGGTVFDFTIGDEPFKTDFATKPSAMWALLDEPTLLGRAGRLAFGMRERLRRDTQSGQASEREGDKE